MVFISKSPMAFFTKMKKILGMDDNEHDKYLINEIKTKINKYTLTQIIHS